jgi:hypothetical protein
MSPPSSDDLWTPRSLRESLGLSLTQFKSLPVAEFADQAAHKLESWRSRIEQARQEVHGLALLTNAPQGWEAKALALVAAAEGAGLRLWLWEVVRLSAKLSVEQPAELLELCAFLGRALDVDEEAYPYDEDQLEDYYDVKDLIEKDLRKSLSITEFHQRADARLLSKALPLLAVNTPGSSASPPNVDWEEFKRFPYFSAFPSPVEAGLTYPLYIR